MCLAMPARIRTIEGDLARADILGNEITVDLRFVAPAQPGDFVLVHAGFAIQRLEADEADELLNLVRSVEMSIEG